MKRQLLISFMVCLTFWGIEVSPTPAQNRQFCKRGALVNPARESKKIKNPEFGFAFDIPANYTSETKGSSDRTYILLYNPNEQELNACCKKNRQIACDGHPSLVTVTIEPAKSDTRLLPELSAVVLRLENIKPTTIANQKAVVYTIKSSLTGGEDIDTSLTGSFLTPNRKHKITVSAFSYESTIKPIDERVFQRVRSSFAFVK
ncbi:hypothetical protein QUA20_02070 [Microcoleus sp. Pol7_A1]|uniref:hypothetical protein n=1 Tax=Microcoleus sp. Pol7_A1 TaxID=2818893 RepID=UPI002FD0DA3F